MYIEKKHWNCEFNSLKIPAELLRNIANDNLDLLQFFEGNSSILLLVMLAEMLNILGVGQVLLRGIIAVILLKVMDLVLILKVTMVSGAITEIGQPFTRSESGQPVLPVNKPSVSRVEELKHCEHGISLLDFTDSGIGFVVEAVCLADFVVCPCP